jgi:hypothetical protein
MSFAELNFLLCCGSRHVQLYLLLCDRLVCFLKHRNPLAIDNKTGYMRECQSWPTRSHARWRLCPPEAEINAQ